MGKSVQMCAYQTRHVHTYYHLGFLSTFVKQTNQSHGVFLAPILQNPTYETVTGGWGQIFLVLVSVLLWSEYVCMFLLHQRLFSFFLILSFPSHRFFVFYFPFMACFCSSLSCFAMNLCWFEIFPTASSNIYLEKKFLIFIMIQNGLNQAILPK